MAFNLKYAYPAEPTIPSSGLKGSYYGFRVWGLGFVIEVSTTKRCEHFFVWGQGLWHNLEDSTNRVPGLNPEPYTPDTTTEL